MDSSHGAIFTLAGLKGGVGRTVAAVNLAVLFALVGRRTLLVDLDPLGNATIALGCGRCGSGCGLECLSSLTAFRERIIAAPEVEGLELWPGGAALSEAEGELWQRDEEARDRLLAPIIETLSEDYDAIFIDAPPGNGPLSQNALAAANVLLLPLDDGAFMGSSLEDTVAKACTLHAGREHVRAFGIAIGSSPSPQTFRLPEACEGKLEVLECGITYDYPAVTGAARAGRPLFLYAPEARVTRSYVELCRELIEKVDNPHEGGAARLSST